MQASSNQPLDCFVSPDVQRSSQKINHASSEQILADNIPLATNEAISDVYSVEEIEDRLSDTGKIIAGNMDSFA